MAQKEFSASSIEHRPTRQFGASGVKLSLGQRGEIIAGKLLTARGLTVIERNYRCRLGEIDIVARSNRAIVFVEVKTRSSVGHGRPAEFVGSDKQARLRRLASYYLIVHPQLQPSSVEFGVVEVVYNQARRAYSAHLIRHAF